MTLSSGLGQLLASWWGDFEDPIVAEQGPQDVDTAAGQRDECLDVSVAFSALLEVEVAVVGETEGLTGCAVYFSYAIGLFLLTEEAGWAGMLMPRLQVRLRPLAASVVLGVIWGLWHLPLLHVPGASDQGLPFLAFLFLVVPTRVLMSTLVDAGRGAVLVAALFHAAFNATCLYVGVVGADHALIWTAGAVTTVLAVLTAVATRVRLFHPTPA